MKGRRLGLAALGGSLLVLAFAAPAFAASNGTTLESSVTASTERIGEHQWTIAKTASTASLDLFRGDSASVTYTIRATDTGTVEKAWLVGTVTVRNAGDATTENIAITVVASTTGSSGSTLGGATLSTSANPRLDPDGIGTYAYRVQVPVIAGATYKATANVTITNHSGALGVPEGPSPSATTMMTTTVTDANASVNIDDSNGQSFAFSGTGTTSYPTTFSCDRDRGAHVNSVGVSSASADGGWTARGMITLRNPAPSAVTLSGVTASAASASATVGCPSLTIPGGGSLTCTWSRALTGSSGGTVTVTATLADASAFDGTSYGGSASFDFTSPTVNEVDRSVNVTDTAGSTTRTLGTVSVGNAGTFSYPMQVGPYAQCGQYAFTNTATFRTPSGKTGSTTSTVAVNVPCSGCTLTIGYWKTHAGLGPQADLMLGKLPVSLGTAGGAKAVTVTTEAQAVTILGLAGDASNGFNKLYTQLLAAKLNIAAGASASSVATTISQADKYLATHDASDWGKLSKIDKSRVLSWASTLDKYNNGLIGPGHCTQ